MADTTTMTYGLYEFSPVPTISVRRQNIQVKNREFPLGFTFEMTLSGTLQTDDPHSIIALDALQEELREAFNKDGKLFELKCGIQTILSTYPRIKSFEFNESNNNWVISCPYTIVIEYDAEEEFDEDISGDIPPYIEEYNEEWQMEFDQEHKYWEFNSENNAPFKARVTRNISVRGKQSWAGPGPTGTPTSGADNAISWLNTILANYDYNASAYGHSLLGFNNLPTGSYGLYDHYRNHTVNETDGAVNLTETWLVLADDDDNKKALEDFSISVRRGVQEPLISVSIEGTIQGLEVRNYGAIGSGLNLPVDAADTAYENAVDAWATIKTRLLSRAQLILTDEFGVTVNVTPLNRVVGHSPPKGIVTYNYEYDNRPCSMISGSLSETITINDNYPTDVFAEILILGRPQGPILQDIGTVTKSTREVIIEAVMPLPTGCTFASLNEFKPDVTELLGEFETEITDVYDQVFKHADNVSWSPRTGRYSRTVGWTFVDCEIIPDTSFTGG